MLKDFASFSASCFCVRKEPMVRKERSKGRQSKAFNNSKRRTTLQQCGGVRDCEREDKQERQEHGKEDESAS